MKFYKNKLVFIVGGSSGIGFAIANELVNLGAKVCIFARGINQLETARQKILLKNSQAEIHIQSVDVLDEQSVKTAISSKIEKFGTPHILLNSAGFARPNYFENISLEDFQATINLNLIGTRNLAYEIMPYFKKNNGGHFISVSSVAGFLGVFGYTDYSASKFALVGFSEALQQEVAKYSIKISVLYPPDTQTEGFEKEAETKPPETQAVSAGNALISPEFLAKKVAKALPKQKFNILPTLDGKIAYYGKRYAPWIVNFIMMRAVKKAQINKEQTK